MEEKNNKHKMYGFTDKLYYEQLQILASIPEIEEILICGSRARGDFLWASEVDLSIKDKDFTRQTLTRLNDKLYESHIPQFFDTHIYVNIKKPDLKLILIVKGRSCIGKLSNCRCISEELLHMTPPNRSKMVFIESMNFRKMKNCLLKML